MKELEENNAAIFAGAGLSAGSGHADWSGLVKDFADELNLDIKKETDLIALVQYHLNANAHNRHQLNQKIANEFHHGKQPNENHKILAKLPINTFWTTNYDRLIETALTNENKVVDVKYVEKHLTTTIHGRKAVVYKMHGDVEHPDDAILSKDDYERYHKTHATFLNALAGDLVSKTFLFVGFSFTDPNLEFVLSRIRVTFTSNQRPHYAIFREVKQDKDEPKTDFEYRKIKQELFIQDLMRFNIKVLLVKEYSQITSILNEIENRFKRKTIYISGSAHEYGGWDSSTAESFISSLSKKLIESDYKIVSGFGLGVGSFVINGVLEEIYLNKKENLEDQLLLRPFPQGKKGKELWPTYRKDMISYAGVSLFVFGNKLENNELVVADGVRKEFEIAKQQNVLLIPVGATGSMAKKLYDEISTDFEKYFELGVKSDFEKLGDSSLTPEDLIESILTFIDKVTK
ncbi:SIR2 family protein [Marinoscillum sp.]|uniref:SIR2 family protein n=1 Tax=Marinoscillum sp. TaxID=2024838 RepID=UPI003BABA4D2